MANSSTISITVPGSKSHTNRALILAALSNGKTILNNAAICDDTKFMLSGLQKFGIKIRQKADEIEIHGCGVNFKKSPKTIKIHTGNAGTTTRFLSALATLTGNKVIIDGDRRMRERPILELTKALNNLGAKVETKNGYPPVTIHPQKLKGGKISVAGNISSQYLSALLMVCPFAENPTKINIEQELYSKPYVTMTLEVMKDFGITIKNKDFRQFEINSKQIKNGRRKSILIQSDASSASYIGAYAALHQQKKIFLKNINSKSLQGDIIFLKFLEKMGCLISEQKNGTLIQGPKILKSLGVVDMNAYPDLVMTFIVLALLTKGKTKITNIGNLRIKETDRLAALENEITKLAKFANLPLIAKTGKDWIEIQNNRLEFTANGDTEGKNKISQCAKSRKNFQQLTIQTCNDHRMAMSFGILTDIFPFLKIENPNCVSKSYTNFWQDLKRLQSKKLNQKPHKKSTKLSVQTKIIIRHPPSSNIILIGLRGSGKSKIGKLLSEKLKRPLLDIDKEIEAHEKMTIKKIVELRGWEYFRAIEAEITKKIEKLKNAIISTGGGTILDEENRKILKKNGKIIYLYVKPEICAKRIGEDTVRARTSGSRGTHEVSLQKNSKTRPPLTNKETVEEEIKQLYKERNGIYCQSATLIFERSENLKEDIKKLLKEL